MDGLDCDAGNDELIDESGTAAAARKAAPFAKLTLRETDDMDLFETNSFTVPRESDEAVAVEVANQLYDYLTVGKGRQRRTGEAETQTTNYLLKSRAVNTDLVSTASVATFASNYDMFDTYAELARQTHSVLSSRAKLEVTTYGKPGGEDLDTRLS